MRTQEAADTATAKQGPRNMRHGAVPPERTGHSLPLLLVPLPDGLPLRPRPLPRLRLRLRLLLRLPPPRRRSLCLCSPLLLFDFLWCFFFLSFSFLPLSFLWRFLSPPAVAALMMASASSMLLMPPPPMRPPLRTGWLQFRVWGAVRRVAGFREPAAPRLAQCRGGGGGSKHGRVAEPGSPAGAAASQQRRVHAQDARLRRGSYWQAPRPHSPWCARRPREAAAAAAAGCCGAAAAAGHKFRQRRAAAPAGWRQWRPAWVRGACAEVSGRGPVPSRKVVWNVGRRLSNSVDMCLVLQARKYLEQLPR